VSKLNERKDLYLTLKVLDCSGIKFVESDLEFRSGHCPEIAAECLPWRKAWAETSSGNEHGWPTSAVH
jgi:hypothetical protein